MDTSSPPAPAGASEVKAGQAGRKLLRVATRCASLDEFLQMFSRYVDETSVTIFTSQPRPVGTRQPFAIQLKNGDNMMRGECEVFESKTANGQPGVRSSMRIRLLHMDEPSKQVHRELLQRAGYVRATRPPPTPLDALAPRSTRPPTGSDAVAGEIRTESQVGEIRTPGASYTLPANPFGELPEEALEYFIECTLYEETGLHPLSELGDLQAPAAAPAPPPAEEPRLPIPDLFDTAPPQPTEAPPVQVGGAPFRYVSYDDVDVDPRARRPSTVTMPVERIEPRRSRLASILIVSVVAAGAGFAVGFLVRDLNRQGGEAAPERAPVDRAAVAATGPVPGAAAEVPAPPEPATPEPPPPAPAATGGSCRVRVITEPPAVAVIWSGSKLGETPLEGTQVPCGEAVVALEHPRYERVERKVAAAAGTPVVIEKTMVRPAGRLDLTSSPAGAEFTVGGKAIGKAPTAANVSAFTQVSVKAQLTGYKPWSQKIYVRGRTFSVHAKLEALPKPTPTRSKRPAAPSPR